MCLKPSAQGISPDQAYASCAITPGHRDYKLAFRASIARGKCRLEDIFPAVSDRFFHAGIAQILRRYPGQYCGLWQ